jgi:6-phosphogluconolactonase (cycloisomerase 2 family)
MLLNTLFSRRFNIAASGLIALILLQTGSTVAESNRGGVLYVMTNKSEGNTVVVFRRNEDGTLLRAQEVSTGGLGSGGSSDPLGSQGSLVLSRDGHILLAVNAGSNELSILATTKDGLRLLDKVPSGGTQPVSVTLHRGVIYVLNAGGNPNLTGFSITESGRLVRISGSSTILPSGVNAGAAEVLFSPDGDSLLVTEKQTGQIDIFRLTQDGRISGLMTQPSNGATPFGLSFASPRTIVVTEAAGGAAGASTVSSYRTQDEDEGEDDGTAALSPVTRSLAIHQTAACWIVTTRNNRFAFAANAGSGTISSFAIAPDGRLSVLAAAAADLGAGFGPTDLGLSSDNRFLYVLSTNTGGIAGFEVRDGALRQVEHVAGLPLSIQGIAVH